MKESKAKPRLMKCRESESGFDLIAPDGYKLAINFGGFPEPTVITTTDVHIDLKPEVKSHE